MGMEVALGKYMTVMCLDFKEDDTKLNFPVTFHIFNNPGVWLQDVAKIRLLDKKKEIWEQGQWAWQSITLSCSDIEFMFL